LDVLAATINVRNVAKSYPKPIKTNTRRRHIR